jgi:pimeloyl-ACP methyl ester carboxylesterase
LARVIVAIATIRFGQSQVVTRARAPALRSLAHAGTVRVEPPSVLPNQQRSLDFMAIARFRLALVVIAFVALLAAFGIVSQLPAAGAAALLHPAHRAVDARPPASCADATFPGEGVVLKGWRCHASGPRRGTLVYLHGIADNRTSAAGIVDRFGAKGFDVVAYDSRAHGDSSGDACTYGFFEKRDLQRVVDTLAPGPVVLFGTSLGAAVAIQEAADDARITALIGAETFSDLRTVAAERAPFFFTAPTIDRAFKVAEREARFVVGDVSPLAAAARITIPVLLIHGAADVDTPAAHSQRVFEALSGPKRLILVPGAGHNQSLRGDVWAEIGQWLDAVIASPR